MDSAGFDRFWKSYPRREAKGDAMRAWKALKPSPELVETIIAGSEKRAAWHRRNATERRFIKLPATWLRAWCWEDEIPEDEAEPYNPSAYCVYCSAYGHFPQQHRA